MRQEYEQELEKSGKHINQCSWEGCSRVGEYPAPKSPNDSEKKYSFCLDHVRQYNKQWDYFSGMSRQEIEDFCKESLLGHRQTTKMGIKGIYYQDTDKLREQIFNSFFNSNNQHKNDELPQTEKDSMEILGVSFPLDWKKIKKRYKELAKTYHPDVNGHGDEERLKIINQAYNHLKSIYNK